MTGLHHRGGAQASPFDAAAWLTALDKAGGGVCLTSAGLTRIEVATASDAQRNTIAVLWASLTPDNTQMVADHIASRSLVVEAL